MLIMSESLGSKVNWRRTAMKSVTSVGSERTHECLYVCACMRACMHAGVCACVRACVHAYVCACMRVCMYDIMFE